MLSDTKWLNNSLLASAAAKELGNPEAISGISGESRRVDHTDEIGGNGVALQPVPHEDRIFTGHRPKFAPAAEEILLVHLIDVLADESYDLRRRL